MDETKETQAEMMSKRIIELTEALRAAESNNELWRKKWSEAEDTKAMLEAVSRQKSIDLHARSVAAAERSAAAWERIATAIERG